jgi:nitrogen fixation NifU-like protein
VSADLGDLYQEVILDHNRRPRNFRAMERAGRKAVGHNPLCGDKVSVYVDLEGDVLRDVSFEGSGCAISKASASMMTEILKGKTRKEAEAMFRKFHALVTGESPDGAAGLGKLVVFSGVSEFPVRVKCATLAWHTLKAALDNRQDAVSTE